MTCAGCSVRSPRPRRWTRWAGAGRRGLSQERQRPRTRRSGAQSCGERSDQLRRPMAPNQRGHMSEQIVAWQEPFMVMVEVTELAVAPPLLGQPARLGSQNLRFQLLGPLSEAGRRSDLDETAAFHVVHDRPVLAHLLWHSEGAPKLAVASAGAGVEKELDFERSSEWTELARRLPLVVGAKAERIRRYGQSATVTETTPPYIGPLIYNMRAPSTPAPEGATARPSVHRHGPAASTFHCILGHADIVQLPTDSPSGHP